MSHDSPAGLRLAFLVSSVLIFSGAVRAQSFFDNTYDPIQSGRAWGYLNNVPRGVMIGPESDLPNFPRRPQSSSPAKISSDLLRIPLSAKAQRALEKAMHDSEMGDHVAARGRLMEALVKYPASAPYTQSLLGVECIETRQYVEAVTWFKQAARALPHESAAHSNLGLSLALSGELEHGEQEIRRALELDKTNIKASQILEALLLHKRAQTEVQGSAFR